MFYYVDSARCTGCGLCLDVCDAGAIVMNHGVPEIVPALCQQCGECVSTCPVSAILSVSEGEPLLARASQAAPELARPRPSFLALPWVGATLAVLGRELLPRLLTVLVNRWETRDPTLGQAPGAARATASSQAPGGGRRLRRHGR